MQHTDLNLLLATLGQNENELPEAVREAFAALANGTRNIHPDDLAVDRFAGIIKAKMARSRAKGKGGWDDPNWPASEINAALRGHLAKGDPRDVGIYAMFLTLRNEATEPVPSAEEVSRETSIFEAIGRRVTIAFNENPIANEFLTEDGDGGISAGIHRMAEEIARLRDAQLPPDLVSQLRKALEDLAAEAQTVSHVKAKELIPDKAVRCFQRARERVADLVEDVSRCVREPSALWGIFSPATAEYWAMPDQETATRVAQRMNEASQRPDGMDDEVRVEQWPFDAQTHAASLDSVDVQLILKELEGNQKADSAEVA